MEQRLIALKTGFEALFNTSSSAEGARKLRALFVDTTRRHRDLLPWSGLLWTPDERKDLWRWFWLPKGSRQIERRDEIEDWFKTLADARNDVIHRGRLTSEVYQPPLERPLSRYVGHLLWVGERVLREAIKAKLGADVLLCGAIARRAWAKATFGDAVRELAKKARAAAKAGILAPLPEAHPPRPLSNILHYLQVETANLVVVGPLRLAGDGYSHEASAYRGKITSSITGSEYVALRAAGAEEEGPPLLGPLSIARRPRKPVEAPPIAVSCSPVSDFWRQVLLSGVDKGLLGLAALGVGYRINVRLERFRARRALEGEFLRERTRRLDELYVAMLEVEATGRIYVGLEMNRMKTRPGQGSCSRRTPRPEAPARDSAPPATRWHARRSTTVLGSATGCTRVAPSTGTSWITTSRSRRSRDHTTSTGSASSRPAPASSRPRS